MDAEHEVMNQFNLGRRKAHPGAGAWRVSFQTVNAQRNRGRSYWAPSNWAV